MHEYINHPMKESMSRILDVRYSDLEEEKALAEGLLKWSIAHQDLYGQAFAHVYLGDYWIAQNDATGAIGHLEQGKGLLGNYQEKKDELLLRLYSLLAVCYEMGADEQSSVEYYLEAITIAQRLGDKTSECMVLNNIAFAFQRHHNYDEAKNYYEQAYEICKNQPRSEFLPLLLSNLVELALVRNDLAEAEKYMIKCEALDFAPEQVLTYHIRNRCAYYAAMGDKEQAGVWGARALKECERFQENRMTSFDDYSLLCNSMIKIGNKEYAREFLNLMEIFANDGLDQVKLLEEQRITWYLTFEPEVEHPAAYRRFYRAAMELRKRSNKARSNALQAKISLDSAIHQREALLDVQEKLEKQANVDELTQVYNRRYFDKQMVKYAENTKGTAFGIIMLDIDYFKEYNDYYGHIDGDNVLQVVSKCLTECKIEGIYPCRYGGDEFVCICDGLSDVQTEQYIKAVQQKLQQYALPHGKSACSNVVTLSIGYAVGEQDGGDSPYELLQLADQGLYDTKLSGRNSYTRKQVSAK